MLILCKFRQLRISKEFTQVNDSSTEKMEETKCE